MCNLCNDVVWVSVIGKISLLKDLIWIFSTCYLIGKCYDNSMHRSTHQTSSGFSTLYRAIKILNLDHHPICCMDHIWIRVFAKTCMVWIAMNHAFWNRISAAGFCLWYPEKVELFMNMELLLKEDCFLTWNCFWTWKCFWTWNCFWTRIAFEHGIAFKHGIAFCTWNCFEHEIAFEHGIAFEQGIPYAIAEISSFNAPLRDFIGELIVAWLNTKGRYLLL